MSGAGRAARRGGRRMLMRLVPGGAIFAAALVLPEFSVGAGDLSGGDSRADPPEPAARPGQARSDRRLDSAHPVSPKLAGVRYAPMIELGTDPAPAVAAVPPTLATLSPGAGRPLAEPLPETVTEAGVQQSALVARPSAPVEPTAPLAAVMPQIPAGIAAAAPSAAPVPDQLAPVAESPAVSAAAAVGAADAVAFATFLPEEQAALGAPAGKVAAPDGMALPAASAVPADSPAVRAAPVPATAAVSQPAGRSVMEQLTPSRIAAVRPAPAPIAAKPAPAPLAAKAAAAAAPPASGARAPLAAPSVPAPVAVPAPAAAAVPKPAPALASPVAAAPPKSVSAFDFRAQLLTRIDGRTAGSVDFQQTPEGLKVRLGSVAEVLADRIAPAELARIRNSSAGNAWLSLAELQSQGVPISYDPVYDEFNIGHTDTRPKAARKVHMDQISAPERGAGAAAMAQVPRPGR